VDDPCASVHTGGVDPSERRTLHWDFFGPSAEGTATHFVRHLDELLQREQLAGECEVGHGSEEPGHHGAWCRCPTERVELLTRALRPRRIT
jgi:hypothetical protein